MNILFKYFKNEHSHLYWQNIKKINLIYAMNLLMQFPKDKH